MPDQIVIKDQVPRGELSRALETAWSTMWENFRLLRGLVGYEDIVLEPPLVGVNVVPHHLGKLPQRWTVMRAYQSAYPTETARSTGDITLNVTAISSVDAVLIVRVWP